jgi:hypothetical protein
MLVARRRTCGHVVMLFRQRGVRRGRRDVCSVRCEIAVCLFACVRVCDVGGFVAE